MATYGKKEQKKSVLRCNFSTVFNITPSKYIYSERKFEVAPFLFVRNFHIPARSRSALKKSQKFAEYWFFPSYIRSKLFLAPVMIYISLEA